MLAVHLCYRNELVEDPALFQTAAPRVSARYGCHKFVPCRHAHLPHIRLCPLTPKRSKSDEATGLYSATFQARQCVLDIDTTVKPLYGHQEGAVVGYNPKKPGRPSHSYHTYSMAGARLVFDVDVVAGNEHTSKHFAPGLWALLDRIPRDLWPALLRGDCGFGNEPIMREAEQRGLAYLFKLRLTANVKRMIERPEDQR